MRKYLIITIFMLVLATPWLYGTSSDKMDSAKKRLNVYNWSSYIHDDIPQMFTKQTQITLHYDVYDSNETLQGKLLTGKTGYDIVGPSSSFAGRQIQAGVYQPLDKTKIPNYKNIDPTILKLLATADPNNQHLIPFVWGANTIGGNLDEIKKRVPVLPENEWDLLFDPKYAKKLKPCGISIFDAPSDVYPIVLNYLGLNTENPSPEEIAKATKAIENILPYIKRFSSSGYINDLATGDLCLVLGYNGDFTIARESAAQAKKPLNIQAFLPKSGVGIWVDTLAITKTAANVDEAHEFLNYMLDGKIAAFNASVIPYAPGSADAKKYLEPIFLNDQTIFLPQEVLDNSFLISPLPTAQQKAISKKWTLLRKSSLTSKQTMR